MIDIAVLREESWPATPDWEALATGAALAALRQTPHGELIGAPAMIEISIRLTDDAAVHALNKAYRGKDRPTNVLSFPMVQADLLDALIGEDEARGEIGENGEVLLGDIVLAEGVCRREAAEKNVPLDHHATHLIVHGTLHLLGYDHIDDAQAEAMEAIEREALASLGISDPYAIADD